MSRLISLFPILLFAAVSGCSVQPLYLDEGTYSGVDMALQYAEPSNRLEQVAYNTISERVRRGEAAGLPTLSLTVSTTAKRVGLSSVEGMGGSDPDNPVTVPDTPLVNETSVTAKVVATVRDTAGEVMFQDSRTASTSYQSFGQIIADDTAREDATERAVRSAAEALRLQLLIFGRFYDADRAPSL